MSEARLVITALVVDQQSPAEVAARYGVHRAWSTSSRPATRSRARPRWSPAPATLHDSMPQSLPGPTAAPEPHDRIRHDRVDTTGSVTLRHNSRLHPIGIGRTHAGTRVILLVHDLQIRVVNAATGELLRDLVLDPTKRYQGTGRPPRPTR